jgi:hypothetical protein
MKTRKRKTKDTQGIQPEEGQSVSDIKKKEKGSTPVPVKKKRDMGNLSFAKTVQQVRMAIENSLEDSFIMKNILPYGYTEGKLREGLELVEEVGRLHHEQEKARAMKKDATRKKDALGREAEKTLSRFVKIARIVFEKEPGILLQLATPGKRRRYFSVWLEKGKIFYMSVLSLEGVVEGFRDYGVMREELEAGRDRLLELENQVSLQYSCDGDMQVASEEKMKVFYRLKRWWGEYRKISRIALKNSPQMLEKFGLVIP